jgi:hypothetical protein
MHLEASEYMMNDHEDDPDFADHFTYFPYDKEKVNERLDYIAQKLFQIRYLDCKSIFQLKCCFFLKSIVLRVRSRSTSVI